MWLGRGCSVFALLSVVVVGACGGNGKTGLSGAAGTAGGSGTGGRAGTTGSAGTTGAAGTTGSAGTTGAAGTTGSAGTTGAAGTTGTAGTTGGGGATGTAGTTGGGGATGTAGTTGAAGTTGTAGTTGAAGTTGSAGATGSGGATGSAGTGGACVTSVSGTVYDPAGTLPLYNVSVYAPTAALAPFSETVSCDRCGTLSGAPAASTVSDALGKFKLEGIPAGVNVPLVFQIGKWRRAVTVPSVIGCTDTPLTDPNLTRLPRSQAEGHIPRIAMSTGGADALECFLRRIGIADSEFTADSGSGRVNLYAGGDGTNSFMTGEAFSAATTLWSSPTKLASYDMIGFSCEGSTSKFVDQKPQSSVDNVVAYANSGGRLLFGHLHFYWLMKAADFSGTATYVGNLNLPPDPVDLTVNQTFPKGTAFAQWLNQAAVNASPTLGQITVSGSDHSVTSVNPPTTEWIYLPHNANDSQMRRSSQYLSFNTPVGTPEAMQCGKVAFMDMHIEDSLGGAGGDDSDPSKPFPSGCKTNANTAMMKALEFLFFDLDACL